MKTITLVLATLVLAVGANAMPHFGVFTVNRPDSQVTLTGPIKIQPHGGGGGNGTQHGGGSGGGTIKLAHIESLRTR